MADDSKVAQFNLRMSAEDAEKLDELARAAKMSKSEYIRRKVFDLPTMPSGQPEKKKATVGDGWNRDLLIRIDKKLSTIYSHMQKNESKPNGWAQVIAIEVLVGFVLVMVLKH